MLRVLFRKLGDKVLEHILAVFVIPAIVAVSVAAYPILKNRLFVDYTFQLPGWVWLSLSLMCLSGIAAAVRSWVSRHRQVRYWKYEHPSDVKVFLRNYFGGLRSHKCRAFVEFRDLDATLELKPGSARRYAAKAARQTGWNIVHKTRGTMQIELSHRR